MAVIICGVAVGGSRAQTSGQGSNRSHSTNAIPPNLFLTDNGFIFSYTQSGERLILTNTIEEAKLSLESRPATQDPEGNWGDVVDGIQVSLRVRSSTFTNGEPITAIMLVRNVTNGPVAHYRPAYVTISKNGEALERKGHRGLQIFGNPLTNLFPQTQHRYLETLNKEYDLSENGEYTVQAVCYKSNAKSKSVSILITNAPSK